MAPFGGLASNMGRPLPYCKGLMRLMARLPASNQKRYGFPNRASTRVPNSNWSQMNASMEMKTEEVLRINLEVLRREHRDLDQAIYALEHSQRADQLTLRRLKKQKLGLKDRIARIEDVLTPDIIA